MLRLVLGALLQAQFQDSEIRVLVEQLRSENGAERDLASRKLKAMGKACLPELEGAVKHPDLEVSRRARHLIRVIGITEHLSENVRRSFPGIEDRLAAADLHAWTEEFLRICAEAGPGKKHGNLRPDDFRGLVGPAVLGAQGDSEKAMICARVGILKLEAAAEELKPLLKDGSAEVRRDVLRTWRLLGTRKAAPEVVPLLNDESPRVRREAAETLGILEARDAATSLVPLLKDPDEETRWQAVVALGNLGARSAIPDIVPLLRDSTHFVRESAASTLWALDAREATVHIAPLLRDPLERVRLKAAAALCGLGSREGAPLLLDAAARDKTVALGPLNFLRCPAGARRLASTPYRWPFPGRKEVPLEDLLRALAGVELHVSNVPGGKIDFPPVPETRDRWRNAAVAIEEILAAAGMAYLLEDDRIVVMPKGEALRAWKEWIDSSRK